MKISLSLRTALMTAFAGIGFCDLYSGSIPATGDTAPTGTKLVTFDSLVYFDVGAPAVPGVIELAGLPVTSDAALATGTIGYARLWDGGTTSMYCTVGTSSGDIRLSTLSAAAGVTLNITALSITVPAT